MPEPETNHVFQSIQWIDDTVRILDQTRLPDQEIYLDITSSADMREAIQSLRVRGAPAIGIAAAYGVYLAARSLTMSSFTGFYNKLKEICDDLASSRPTAVNLQWALDQVLDVAWNNRECSLVEIKQRLLTLAKQIHSDDKKACASIGLTGQELVPDHANILTHCNTGSLATSQYGTALSMIYHAHLKGKEIHVWVDETRPLLQGSRLTSWELLKSGIPHHIITDSMAGWLMKRQQVDLVVVGTDRVAGNGDTANKIGTYALAVLANHHNIPFYVAAPLSSIDLSIQSGADIPIEERSADELRNIGGCQVASPDAPVYNPAFDVTPHELISAFVTENGIVRPDFKVTLPSVKHGSSDNSAL